MTTKAPKIDRRSFRDIVIGVEKLAEHYTEVPEVAGWKRRTDGGSDAGSTLIKIFARMTEQVIERLNQVPEKNFLAFLDLIGTRMAPPRPSRAPLTFAISTGSTAGALVPSGSTVSAPPMEGDDEEVIFETERELVVTLSRPTAAFIRIPEEDCWGDVSQILSGTRLNPVLLFTANRSISHKLYLAQKDIFTLPGPKTIVITLVSSEATALNDLPLQWSCWDGTGWHVLSTESKLFSKTSWQITIVDPPIPEVKAINNIIAPWICVRLEKPLPSVDPIPTIDHIQAHYEVGDSGLLPESGFTDTRPLDLGKDFFPFGEQPGFNVTFYIGSQQAFSRKNAPVTMSISLTNVKDDKAIPRPAKPSPDLRLAWEFWNTHTGQWDILGESGPGASHPSRYEFADGTAAFTAHGSIEFNCPAEIGPVDVNGQLNFWIRVRIVAGNYGDAARSKKTQKEFSPKLFQKLEIPMYELIPATYRPPSIQSMTIKYTHSSLPKGMDAVLSFNDSIFEDHLPDDTTDRRPFSPFRPGKEKFQALYLGFDKPFGNQPVTLYAGVEEGARDQSSPDAPKLIWEYSSQSRSGWTVLWVEDETGGFAETGLIRFIGPLDLVPRTEFGLKSCWLRVRQENAKVSFSPRLRCLLVNTTWAAQVNTVRNEWLGSSTGEPNQVFHLIQTPVLQAPHITVREQKMPSGIELEKIQTEEGMDAIVPASETSSPSGEIWIRWHEVTNFFGSGPLDRHFVINHLTGEVRFGDGRHGMIPTQDSNNIRATRYRTGGGNRGNLPAGTITQLKTTIPYVDAVVNHEAAGSGAEPESLENVKRFGPRSLRHRDRAVTLQDYKDLTYRASADVARAAVISPRYNPASRRMTAATGQGTGNLVKIIIVPHTSDPRPEPTRGLENRVRQYLVARSAPTVDLQISGADWVKVSIDIRVVPVSLQMAGTLGQTVTEAIKRFLHPLLGGFDGRGWDFGRGPYRSDLYALIEPIEGVDHVQSLNVVAEPEISIIPVESLNQFLIFSGDHHVVVVPPEEGA